MKILKLGLISIFGLFLLMTAMSMLLPSQVVVSRAIDIHQPPGTVIPLINDFANWNLWMDQFDSNMVKVSPVSKGPGARLTMDKLTIHITDTANNTIAAVWQTGSSRPLPGTFTFLPTTDRSTVTVQWQFVQTVKWYPWEKFATIVSDKVLGPTMEKSLDNLKNIAEHSSPSG